MEQQLAKPEKGWVIGHVLGAPVVLAPSSALAVLVVTAIMAPALTRAGATGWLLGVIFLLLLALSILVHELAHGVVAHRRGHQPNAFVLTLWGGHTTFVDKQMTPGTTAAVAFAGPAANLVLWLLLSGSAMIFPPLSLTHALLSVAGTANAVVGLVNLVPGFPLDGGRILFAAVWWRTGHRATAWLVSGWAGRAAAILIAAALVVVELQSGRASAILAVVWAVLVGGYLWSGAGHAIKAGRQEQAVTYLNIEQVLLPATVISDTTTVEEALSDCSSNTFVVINRLGTPYGYFETTWAEQIPHEKWATTAVSALAVRMVTGTGVPAKATGITLLTLLLRAGADRGPVLVYDGEKVVGLVTPALLEAAVRH